MSSAERMRDLLLTQYYDKPVINAILNAVGTEIDTLGTVRDDIRNNMWISTASGAQLDMCGEVVGLSRVVANGLYLEYFRFYNELEDKDHQHGEFGVDPFRHKYSTLYTDNTLSDNEYRQALLVKVVKNTTDGTRNSILKGLQLIFDVTCYIHNAMNANMIIGIGKELTSNELLMIRALSLVIRDAGVGLEYAYTFTNKPFGFSKKGISSWAGMGVGQMVKTLDEEIE